VLLVQPVDLESPVRLPGDQPVLTDGTIQLGKYGRPAVAGRTVEEIERLVRERLAAQEKDAGPITVRVITRASKVFYVLGEVNSPGSFTLTGRETVLDAILTAGGLTPRAVHQGIILVRPTPAGSCRIVLPVCYDDIVQAGDTATNYQIFPGDRVFVPSPGCLEQLFHKRTCAPCTPPQTLPASRPSSEAPRVKCDFPCNGAPSGQTAFRPAVPGGWPMRFVYFTKTLQSLDVAGLIAFCKEIGLDGVDFTVRPGYPVTPDNAVAEMPKAARAFRTPGWSSGW
jgi:hypothetical protein